MKIKYSKGMCKHEWEGKMLKLMAFWKLSPLPCPGQDFIVKASLIISRFLTCKTTYSLTFLAIEKAIFGAFLLQNLDSFANTPKAAKNVSNPTCTPAEVEQDGILPSHFSCKQVFFPRSISCHVFHTSVLFLRLFHYWTWPQM